MDNRHPKLVAPDPEAFEKVLAELLRSGDLTPAGARMIRWQVEAPDDEPPSAGETVRGETPPLI